MKRSGYDRFIEQGFLPKMQTILAQQALNKRGDILEKKKISWKNLIGYILFASLVASVIYACVNIITSPSVHPADNPHEKIKSDYFLMLLQCGGGALVMFLPSLIHRKWNIQIPNYMYVSYFIFLYCAIFLGEVTNFYYVIPYWDVILHTFSGGMLGALGFTIVSIMNDDPVIEIKLSPSFVALFAFCFAVCCGTIWEIYEFSVDAIFDLNMQKYALENGTPLTGKGALADTMEDIIVDVVGALVVSLAGYFAVKERERLAKKRGAEDLTNNVP